MARKGLKADMPEVHALLARFRMSLDAQQAVMLENQRPGTDPAKTAAAWVQANQALVKGWTG